MKTQKRLQVPSDTSVVGVQLILGSNKKKRHRCKHSIEIKHLMFRSMCASVSVYVSVGG